MEKLKTEIPSEFQWELAEIRADIEQRKVEGSIGKSAELEIVMDALYLINQLHEDEEDLQKAQELFWEASALPLDKRIQKLWQAIDLFIQ